MEENLRTDQIFQNYSIAEFCKKAGISKPNFYLLRKKGLMPKIFKLGRRSLITEAELRQWFKNINQKSK